MFLRTFIVLVHFTLYPCATMAADGVDPQSVHQWFEAFPEVTEFEIDSEGHLTHLVGVLSHDSGLEPAVVAPAFLTSFSGLFPAAPGSVFSTTSVVRRGDGSAIVEVSQTIGDFPVSTDPLIFEFGSDGRMASVQGVVKHSGDSVDPKGDFLSEGVAMELGQSHFSSGGDLVMISAGRRFDPVSEAPAWRVRGVYNEVGVARAYAVLLDAVTGGKIGEVDVTVVDDFVDLEETGPGGVSPYESDWASINGCVPLDPPLGAFWNLPGYSEWEEGLDDFEEWFWRPEKNHTYFLSNATKLLCDPDPEDVCNHGAVYKNGSDINFPPGYDRVLVDITDLKPHEPEDVASLTVRWLDIDGVDRAVTQQRLEAGTQTVEFGLSAGGGIDGSRLERLKLEIDSRRTEGRFNRFDLLPGGWLRLPDPPTMVRSQIGTPQNKPLVVGSPFWVRQAVVNYGCEMPANTYAEMRNTRIQFQKQSSPGAWSDVDLIPSLPTWFPGRFAKAYDAGGGATRTWQFGPFNISLDQGEGWYRARAVFDSHPEQPSPWRVFHVSLPPPDLAIDAGIPATLHRQWIADKSRLNLLNLVDARQYPGDYFVRVSAHQSVEAGGEVDATVRFALRLHDDDADGDCTSGFTTIASALVSLGTDSESIDLVLGTDELTVIENLMAESNWEIFDARFSLDPVIGEPDVANNQLCIPSWLVVADAAVGHLDVDVSCVDGDDPSTCFGPIFLEDFGGVHGPGSQSTFVSPGVDVTHWDGHDHQYGFITIRRTPDGTPPRLVWSVEAGSSSERVAGALIYYRREHAGTGGLPRYAGGAEECVSDAFPAGNCDMYYDMGALGPHQYDLASDNQWHALVWKRGTEGPFGNLGVLSLAEGEVVELGEQTNQLRLILVPDTNPCGQEPNCGDYPATYIGFVGAWEKVTEPETPDVVFTGLKVLDADGTSWEPLPQSIPTGDQVVFGAEFTNTSNQGYVDLEVRSRIEITANTKNGVLSDVMEASGTMTFDSSGEPQVLGFPSQLFAVSGIYTLHATSFTGPLPGQLVGDSIHRLEIKQAPQVAVELVFRDLSGTWLSAPSTVPLGSSWPVGISIENRASEGLVGRVSADLSLQPVDAYGSPTLKERSSHSGSMDIGDGQMPYPNPLDHGEIAYLALPPDWVAEFASHYRAEVAVYIDGDPVATLASTVSSCNVPPVDLP